MPPRQGIIMQYLSKGKQGNGNCTQAGRRTMNYECVSTCYYKPVYSTPREPINHGELAVSTAANQIIWFPTACLDAFKWDAMVCTRLVTAGKTRENTGTEVIWRLDGGVGGSGNTALSIESTSRYKINTWLSHLLNDRISACVCTPFVYINHIHHSSDLKRQPCLSWPQLDVNETDVSVKGGLVVLLMGWDFLKVTYSNMSWGIWDPDDIQNNRKHVAVRYGVNVEPVSPWG